ncbi:centriole, cilia and spindle-associated protein [Discoglossus pictus]
MHCKTLRSEYMKRFKDPHWEAYGKCYEELLKYRVTRRLLEHAHNPWLWEGWEEASDSSSGNSTPPKLTKPVPAPSRPQEAEGSAKDIIIKEPGPTIQPPSETKAPESGNYILRDVNGQAEHQNKEEKVEVKKTTKEKSSSHPRPLQNQSASSSQDGRKPTSPHRKAIVKEIRQPFALYAWGEKMKDTGSQKTHNVCAPTTPNEIHASALRARSRRQKEKRRHILQRQRARSADTERALRKKASPVDNPWMTEYMRCYSARAP